jgi:hypothetical protein
LAGKAAAGVVSAGAADLAKGVLHSMLLTKLKTLTVVVISVALLAIGAGRFGARPQAAEPLRGVQQVTTMMALGVPEPAAESPLQEFQTRLGELTRKLAERDKMEQRIAVLKDWREDVLKRAIEDRDELEKQIASLGKRIESLQKELTTKPQPKVEDTKTLIRIEDSALEAVDLKRGTVTVALGRKVDEILTEVAVDAKGTVRTGPNPRLVARLVEIPVVGKAEIYIKFRSSPSVANNVQQELKELEKMLWWPATLDLGIQDGRLIVTKITAWRGSPRDMVLPPGWKPARGR